MLTRNNFIIVYILLLWGASACANKPLYQASTEGTAIPVSAEIDADADVAAMIQPYKTELDKTMNEVIGYSEVELVKQRGESTLGNFVADAMLKKSIEAYGKDIDMAAITIGGLRNPLPEGKIMLKAVYELMPFENSVYVLKLSGVQAKQLFDYLAEKKNIAIANSMVIMRGDTIVNVFVGGKPLDEAASYTLAISDYLAGGGDHMAFLKDAEIVEKLPLKVRDLLVEEIREQHASGKKIKANIEGRIKVL